MADETNATATDLRVAELQALLKEQTEKHAFQTKRADELEKKLRTVTAGVKEQTTRAEKAEAQLRSSASAIPEDGVVLGGKLHKVIGQFRADNTFVEVKRGHCPEGVTLVAIDKVH